MEKLRTELIMAAKQYVEPAHGENDEQAAQEAEQLKQAEALKAQEEEAEQIRQAALRAREEEDEKLRQETVLRAREAEQAEAEQLRQVALLKTQKHREKNGPPAKKRLVFIPNYSLSPKQNTSNSQFHNIRRQEDTSSQKDMFSDEIDSTYNNKDLLFVYI